MNAFSLATLDLFIVLTAGTGAIFFLRTWVGPK